MQEDVENRTLTLVINSAKLTERELMKAASKFLAYMKNRARSASQEKAPARHHGKMTVKQLAAQNKGMQSVEVTDANIGSFNRVARKYGIDYAPFKVKGKNKYLVFFKASDNDAITAAFKEYTARELEKAKRPSVLKKLRQLQAQITHPVKDREKHKEPER